MLHTPPSTCLNRFLRRVHTPATARGLDFDLFRLRSRRFAMCDRGAGSPWIDIRARARLTAPLRLGPLDLP